MVNAATISAINKVLKTYFEKHPVAAPVPAKDLMPQFIGAGIFPADRKNGLPIRSILRQLDKAKQLHLIPYVLAERKQKNTNWFFAAKNSFIITPKSSAEKKPTAINKPTRQTSDEAYVIDLCDEILKERAVRQHKLNFLLGDKSSTGRQSRLPVDAYYPSLKLVVEYKEVQHTKPVFHFDKPHIKTVSGVHRGEQRKIYDQRRREVLPKNGIALIEVSYELFNCDGRARIVRNKDSDRAILLRFFANMKILKQ